MNSSSDAQPAVNPQAVQLPPSPPPSQPSEKLRRPVTPSWPPKPLVMRSSMWKRRQRMQKNSQTPYPKETAYAKPTEQSQCSKPPPPPPPPVQKPIANPWLHYQVIQQLQDNLKQHQQQQNFIHQQQQAKFSQPPPQLPPPKNVYRSHPPATSLSYDHCDRALSRPAPQQRQPAKHHFLGKNHPKTFYPTKFIPSQEWHSNPPVSSDKVDWPPLPPPRSTLLPAPFSPIAKPPPLPPSLPRPSSLPLRNDSIQIKQPPPVLPPLSSPPPTSPPSKPLSQPPPLPPSSSSSRQPTRYQTTTEKPPQWKNTYHPHYRHRRYQRPHQPNSDVLDLFKINVAVTKLPSESLIKGSLYIMGCLILLSSLSTNPPILNDLIAVFAVACYIYSTVGLLFLIGYHSFMIFYYMKQYGADFFACGKKYGTTWVRQCQTKWKNFFNP